MPSATASDGRVIPASEAARNVQQFNRQMNGSRWTPPVLRRTQEIRDSERVHVFSVSPWGDTVAMGAWGSFIIPPCPEGIPYVEFLMHDSDGKKKAVPGIMMQTYVQDETRNAWHEEDGREWAEKLLNNDVGIPKMFSRNRVGMMVVAGSKPTHEELQVMNEELQQYLEERVTEAREWHTDPVKKKGITREVHWLAARRLNLSDEVWMTAENPKGRQKCPMCGTFSDPGVIKCGSCKEYVFDHAAYAAMQSEQAAQMAAAAPARKSV